MNVKALVVIAKYPDRNNVKTRLKESMSDERRLNLYISLLESTLRKLGSVPEVDTFVAFSPESGRDYFRRFGTGLILLPEGDLGIKMLYSFRELFKAGYQRVVLAGADIPALSPVIIAEALEFLSKSDLVFGPATDGGYYLVGMRMLIKEIFHGVPWSSRYTLHRSCERARQSGYSVAFTEMLSDIDTIEDVRNAGLTS